MSITDNIQQLQADFVITEGRYDLTADALEIRSQRPLYAGDDYSFNFTLLQADGSGNAEDISGATIRFTAKYRPADTDGQAIVQKVATIPVGTDGKFSIAIDKADVPGPHTQRGLYDIQLTTAGGATRTILSGDIEFLAQMTVTTP